MKDKISALESELTNAKNLLQQKNNQLAEVTRNLKEKETATMQALMSQEKTTDKISAFENQINSLKSKLTEKENAISQATAKIDELSTAAASFTQSKQDAEALAKELEANKQKIIEQQQIIKALQAELDSIKAKQSELIKKNADTDKDGVVDSADACPDTPQGTAVDSKGCAPDSDKDGITDSKDLCPDTPAGTDVNAMGCAKNNAIVLEGVNFKTGTATLTETAKKTLMAAASILKNSATDQQFEVAGYTDSVGNPDLNKQLSERRAKAVKAFLVEQGIAEKLLVAKGYGQDNPIADNATREGRAKNRRVELHKITVL